MAIFEESNPDQPPLQGSDIRNNLLKILERRHAARGIPEGGSATPVEKATTGKEVKSLQRAANWKPDRSEEAPIDPKADAAAAAAAKAVEGREMPAGARAEEAKAQAAAPIQAKVDSLAKRNPDAPGGPVPQSMMGSVKDFVGQHPYLSGAGVGAAGLLGGVLLHQLFKKKKAV